MKKETKNEIKDILKLLFQVSFELIKMIMLIYFIYLAISSF